MFVLAWLIERLVLRHLVNQEGVTLLMATLGITYFLDGLGQTIFGSDIYKIDVGMPKDPVFLLDSVFPGGVLVNLEDVYAACIAALLVVVLSLFSKKPVLVAPCVRWPMTTKPLSRLAFRLTAFG
jgi:branched-chain amino acid transport system permease protein